MLDWAYLGSIVASLTSAVSGASSSYCWGTSQPYAWLLVGGLTILLFILVAVCLAGCCGLCGFAAGFAAARVGPRALLPAAFGLPLGPECQRPRPCVAWRPCCC